MRVRACVRACEWCSVCMCSPARTCARLRARPGLGCACAGALRARGGRRIRGRCSGRGADLAEGAVVRSQALHSVAVGGGGGAAGEGRARLVGAGRSDGPCAGRQRRPRRCGASAPLASPPSGRSGSLGGNVKTGNECGFDGSGRRAVTGRWRARSG